jgi:hypothetical protein
MFTAEQLRSEVELANGIVDGCIKVELTFSRAQTLMVSVLKIESKEAEARLIMYEHITGKVLERE